MIKAKYTVKDFLPLILIGGAILLFSIFLTFCFNNNLMFGMRMFMGGFFMVFGLLKASKLTSFVEAYQTYDLVAKRSKAYAYIYPFIEIGLGLLYFTWVAPVFTLITTIILMTISAVGVYLKLKKHEVVMCACLGTVFKVPMTWVTLAENVLMVMMAIAMLVT